MTTDEKHLRTVQVSAEPNGYTVWLNFDFHSMHTTYQSAIRQAQDLVQELKPEYQVYGQ